MKTCLDFLDTAKSFFFLKWQFTLPPAGHESASGTTGFHWHHSGICMILPCVPIAPDKGIQVEDHIHPQFGVYSPGLKDRKWKMLTQEWRVLCTRAVGDIGKLHLLRENLREGTRS